MAKARGPYRVDPLGHKQKPKSEKPPKTAQQEPVAWERPIVYTPPHMVAPAQRTWVSLTDEEMHACWDDLLGTDAFTREGIARAIEAKLEEKNT